MHRTPSSYLLVVPLLLAAIAAPPFAGAARADSVPLSEATFREWSESRGRLRPDTTMRGGQPAVRCATPHGTPELRAAVEERLLLDELFGSPLEVQERKRTIPLVYHVIRHPNGNGEIPDAILLEQTDLLNAAFKKTKVVFDPFVNRVTKKKWYKNCAHVRPNGTPNPKFNQMVNQLAIDPATTINLYSCAPKGGILGIATLPFSLPPEDPRNAIVVRWDTFPGGAAFPYDEGWTAVHEMGHFLGLFHTFEQGCAGMGDFVGDTPFEGVPAFGCPVGRDTCPDLPGLDPVTNPMDYSDDACFDRFTKKQHKRMKQTINQFRPDYG